MRSETEHKQSILDTYAESCMTLILVLVTPILANFIAAANAQLGIPALIVGESLAAGSFIVGQAKTIYEDHFPKKPLSAQNPTPAKIMEFKPVNSSI
jgi:hypothetical protein